MDAHPLNILTYGWEFYPQKRLDPGTFDGHHPQYLFLGQYGGFEGKGSTGSPHGSATYRLNILLPSKPDEYALELPEIYSASRVWVNGSLVSRLGDISGSGQPAIRTGMVTFQAASQARDRSAGSRSYPLLQRYNLSARIRNHGNRIRFDLLPPYAHLHYGDILIHHRDHVSYDRHKDRRRTATDDPVCFNQPSVCPPCHLSPAPFVRCGILVLPFGRYQFFSLPFSSHYPSL